MINETLEADRAYRKDKADAYDRGYAKGKADAQPHWVPVTKEEMFKAGYEGREIRFRVDGRLFAIRELAQ